MTAKKADIAVIGLAVMGQNLILNMNDHGVKVVAYNRTHTKVSDFIQGPAKGTDIKGASSLEDMISLLESPRKVMMMVRAGEVVDQYISQLVPLLSAGDVIIDGGNSDFIDTERRVSELAKQGLHYIGMGVSGGEEGARHGPSIMPGGDERAWPLVKDIFQRIAARTESGEVCCDWIGAGGAGHFVKMVHNGIEYGMMQAFAEGFELLDAKKEMNLDVGQISEIWQHGSVVRSWLLDLIADALRADKNLSNLSDYVDDSGEGRWTVQDSIDLGIPTPVLTLALQMRFRSRQDSSFAGKVLNAMRAGFGGHSIRKTE